MYNNLPPTPFPTRSFKFVLEEGVNRINRLATKGKKYYRLPTKHEKNYRLPTGKLLTDYRHYLYFFSERLRVYCIFPTFLGNNQRYHVTSLFTSQYHKRRILKSVCRAYAKNVYNPPSPKHYMRQMLLN